MDKNLIKKKLDSINLLLEGIKTPELRAKKIKEELQAELKKAQDFDLLLGAQKGLVEMYQEINKKELSEEIANAIILLDDYILNSKFTLKNAPINSLSIDLSAQRNEIRSLLETMIQNE